ncbi:MULTISPECIES: FlgO family outer membrane protein [Gulbenkiania]|uniref:FlgO domain-containing protein n=2 Tax=Gulbenkiania TaxID=397456 RepID=A0A0K6GTQ9_9NEIS|nr:MULTISPECIES: FlgO family outer membrane protein [Gulbenkiania]TCW31901.1 TolB-like protein [Gulbenkiania mobilis]CUA81997.1 hypothetical protein Ga0061063_0845 [Gulbenkiania indica]
MKTSFFSALLISVLLGGCAATSKPPEASTFDVISTNYHAADCLLQPLRLVPSRPLIVATLVNVDALGESSRMGRMFSEQIASRFTHKGYQVIELKLRENLFMKSSEGELMLSREVRDVSRVHQAQAVIVGTYAASSDKVYLNLKAVEPSSSVVLSAHDYAVPLDSNVRSLLGGRSRYSY